jgi:HK97 family phage major capsid protein
MKTIKELLTTGTGTEGSLLIMRKIHDVLWDEVQKALVGRQFAAIVFGPSDIPGSSIDINTVDANSMSVYKVAEGALIPVDVAAYSNTNVRPVKYGVRPLITKEMIEDGKFNLIQHNVQYAGKKMAENETSLILTALDGAGITVSGGAALLISDITSAVQQMRENDFSPKVMLIGPEAFADLMNIDTFVEADKLGSREMHENGFIGRVFGMDVHMFSSTASPTTTYSKYVYILDPSQAFVIAEKRPVTVENYDDLVNDMSGVVITQRIAVSLLRSNAVARITTS